VSIPQLEPDEPLSPELVLVLPPELRAQALARLGPPVWPAPRSRRPEPALPALRRAAPQREEPTAKPVAPASAVPTVREPLVRSVATLVLARAVQLGAIFIVVTILTLVLSLVAQAFR
jgi:hypothetical protein